MDENLAALRRAFRKGYEMGYEERAMDEIGVEPMGPGLIEQSAIESAADVYPDPATTPATTEVK